MQLSQAKSLYMDYVSSYQSRHTLTNKKRHFQLMYEARGDMSIYAINPISYITLLTHAYNATPDPLHPSTITMIVVDTARKLKIQASPHTLRHTFATTLIQSWVAVTTVKELMWHDNLNTTMRYIKVGTPEMIKASKVIRI